MRNNKSSVFSKKDPLLIGTVVMVILSIFQLIVIHFLGYGETPSSISKEINFLNYFDKPNWYLYPIFFFVIYPLIYYTWVPFMDAWRLDSESEIPILRNKNGSIINEGNRDKLIVSLLRYRAMIIIIAFLSSIIFNWNDTRKTRDAYYADSYFDQIFNICDEPDFFVKWLYEYSIDNSIPAINIDCSQIKEEFGNTHGFLKKINAVNPPASQVYVTLTSYFQQVVLVFFAFTMFFQVLLQIIFFGFFNQFSVAKDNNITIWLNHRSEFYEFGLRRWNYALDTMYWAFTVGLIIPIISRLAQPTQALDTGQKSGSVLLVSLTVLPFLLTIFSRQRWVWDCEHRIAKISDKIKKSRELEMYRKQKLWPLDSKLFAKVAILLALSLLHYLAPWASSMLREVFSL
jgi:hypothetical protein